MSENATLPSLTIPPEVEAFAAENGALAYLRSVAAFTERLFSGLPIIVRVVDDPELSYNRTIVFEVEVRGWDSDRLFAAQQHWTRDVVSACPTTHTHLFGICVWPVE